MKQLKAIMSVLANRNTRGLVFGTSISSAATAMFNVVAAIFVTEMTGRAMNLGVIFLIATLPLVILSPIAGVMCDRFNLRLIYISSDSSRSLVLVLMVFLFEVVDPTSQVLLLYVTAFILSLIDVFYTTSYHALVPNLVQKEKILETNIALATMLRISPVISPVLGVFLYSTFGMVVSLLAISIIFFLAFVMERPIAYQSTTVVKTSEKFAQTAKSELSNFVSMMKGDVRITSLNFNGLATHLFLFPFLMIGMPFIIINALEGKPAEYGMVELFAAIGTLVSVAFVPAFKHLGSSRNLLYGMIGMFAGVLCFLPLNSGVFLESVHDSALFRVVYFAAVCFIIHIFFGFYGVFFTNYLHENIQKDKLGKGMAIQFTLIGIGRMLGFLLFGYLFTVSIEVSVIVLVLGMFSKFLIHIPFLREEAHRNASVV